MMPPPSSFMPSLNEHPQAGMGYLCTRIRAMSARFLLRAHLETARTLKTPSDLFELLLETDYSASLREELFELDDVTAFESRLLHTHTRRVERVSELVAQCASGSQYLVTGDWDLHHVRALLRWCVGGKDLSILRQVPVAAGTMTPERFVQASTARNPRELLERLADWMPELATALARVLPVDEEEAPSLPDLELALEHYHYREILACAGRVPGRENRTVLAELSALEVDLANLRTALRLLGRQIPADEADRLYVPGGQGTRRDFDVFIAAEQIEQIFSRLKQRPLSRALEKGMLYFISSGRPSIFERFFDEQRCLVKRRLARVSPVSIATPLWYLARAHNELVNLRVILRGILFSLPAGALQEKLVYV